MKPRNGHACAPIMRKGGVHEKSRGAKRREERQALQKELRMCADKNKATDGRLVFVWRVCFWRN